MEIYAREASRRVIPLFEKMAEEVQSRASVLR